VSPANAPERTLAEHSNALEQEMQEATAALHAMKQTHDLKHA
jgi:hypothetical protein